MVIHSWPHSCGQKAKIRHQSFTPPDLFKMAFVILQWLIFLKSLWYWLKNYLQLGDCSASYCYDFSPVPVPARSSSGRNTFWDIFTLHQNKYQFGQTHPNAVSDVVLQQEITRLIFFSKELVVSLGGLVAQFEMQFAAVAAKYIEEEKQSGTSATSGFTSGKLCSSSLV